MFMGLRSIRLKLDVESQPDIFRTSYEKKNGPNLLFFSLPNGGAFLALMDEQGLRQNTKRGL